MGWVSLQVGFALILTVEISDRVFELDSGKGVYNRQVVLLRIYTIIPWIIPFLVTDFNGGFWDLVLFWCPFR